MVVRSGQDTRSHISDFSAVGYNTSSEQLWEFLQWVVTSDGGDAEGLWHVMVMGGGF
jgi:hypothetical protein